MGEGEKRSCLINFIIGFASFVVALYFFGGDVNERDPRGYSIIILALLPGVIAGIIKGITYDKESDYINSLLKSLVFLWLGIIISNLVLIKYSNLDFIFFVYLCIIYYPMNILSGFLAGLLFKFRK